MSSKSQSKGFLFTVEAAVVLIVLIFLFLSFHNPPFQKINLGNEVLFMQVQDVVEACSLKNDYSTSCIKQVEKVNPHVKITCVSEKHKCKSPLINRSYLQVSAELA